jgi:hypothetical protein
MVFQILNRESNPVRNVCAFFDEDLKMKGKTLSGKKILTDHSKIENFIVKNKIK